MKLWTAQTISVFGSTITREALPLVAILTLAATPAQVGLLAALSMVPVLVVGLPAGVWVDRLRRRPILLGADLGRAIFLFSIPLAALLGVLTLFQLYLVAILAGTLTVFFSVADNSFLPSVVARENLLEANSKLGMTDSVAEIGAPALGGILIQWLTAPLTLLVDAVSYLVSAFLLGLIRTPELPPTPNAEKQSFWQDIGGGLRWVFANPYLRAVAGSSATFSFFGGFIGALYALFVVRELGLSPATLGLLVGAGGISSLIGAALTGWISRRFRLGTVLIASRFLSSLVGLSIPLAYGSPPTLIAILLVGQLLGDGLLTIYFINTVSLRQSVTPDPLLGRMNASMDFLITGVGPLGLLLGGLLGEVLGVRATVAIGVLGGLSGCLWLFFSPIRELEIAPVLSDESVEY
jgi:MFS family permease